MANNNWGKDRAELRSYREAKSDERLFILPPGFKDGADVWVLDPIYGEISKHLLIEWIILMNKLYGKVSYWERNSLLFSPNDIGKTIFLTQKDAETKRQEMIENKYDFEEEPQCVL